VCFLGKNGGKFCIMEMTLNDLPINTQAVIISNSNMRLQELGFCVGEKVMITIRAVFGGPIAVKVNSSLFALSRSEAECIYIDFVQ